MQIDQLRGFTDSELEQLIDNKRIILFSPRLRNRNALMGTFTALPDVYYYRLYPSDTALNTFLLNITSELIGNTSHTQALLQKSKVKIGDVAEAFAADLASLTPKASLLILDDYDMLPPSDEAAQFFNQLLKCLPNGFAIIINGRMLPYYPWQEMVERGDAVVLGEDQALDGGIFTAAPGQRPHLEVYGFGTGKVFVNGLSIDEWDGPLPRNLFFYFVDHQMVTRDEIFETFWPGLNTKEATNVFHVTKRKISERLGYELTYYAGGFYRPSSELSIHYDVRRFEELYNAGASRNDLSDIKDYYGVVRLYRSEFLHNYDMTWINERREQLRQHYADALINIGRMHQSTSTFEKAVHYYLRALRELPLREDIHRALMSIYHEQGENEKAVQQYRLLESLLQRQLKIKPSQSTIALYNLIIGEMR